MSNRDSKSELQVFLTGLDTACEQISKDYFYFPVYSEKGTIYRERVYCYELYHQLRLALRRGFKYVLSGEVDKRMHPVLSEEGKDKVIPDFLVHVPATMDNLVVMEVKSPNAKIEGICKDIKTIRTFINKMKYNYGIILVYGQKEDVVKAFEEKLNMTSLNDDTNNKIILLWHQIPNCRPIRYYDPVGLREEEDIHGNHKQKSN